MDTQVRTSFIPKKPIETGAPQRPKAGAGILFFLAFVIFLGSVVLAGGTFAYEKYLHGSIDSKSDQLTKARAAFEPATIQYLQRLDDRLKYGKQILASHISPSNLFTLLAASTLTTVSYTKFNYTLGPDSTPVMALEGTTRTFSDVALQSDEFNKQRPLHDVIFSNFNVQENGSVNFAVNANIEPGFILYKSLLDGSSAVQTSQPQTPVDTSGQTTTPPPTTGTSTNLIPTPRP